MPLQEMSIVGEGEEAFFDTADHSISEESVVVKEKSDYDTWLSEPQSVKERRNFFLSKMGFVERSSIAESEMMGPATITESSGGLSSGSIDENLLSERRRSNSEANCSVDYSDWDWLDDISTDVVRETNERLVSAGQYEMKQTQVSLGENPTMNKKMQRVMTWWRSFKQKIKKNQGPDVSTESKLGCEEGKMTRMKIELNQKKYMECTAVYAGQELKAHNGLIWTIKFSPDGQYLASGGEDGVVCIWRVTMLDASCKSDKCCYSSLDIEGTPRSQKNKSSRASIIIPEKIFHLEEVPLQKFLGHSNDVLDLAWSPSNYLLSSSMDKTVRLWHADSDKCLGVFRHCDYVTCVQFNPVDESYFISGSIDGKVRVWGISRSRVEEWANVRDIVTAVCYQPNGKGFVVGSLSGSCSFYESPGDELLLKAEINIQGKKKSSGPKITGIQFLNNDSQRVMITSEDSKIRILDGFGVVHKYRGLKKSGGQMSASFTSSGRHIVSIGEHSRIYFWNYDDLCIQTPKQAKSTCSCENFFSDGASVVLPWTDMDTGHNNLSCISSPTSVLKRDHQESSSRIWDSERFSLANWFSMDSSSRASITWPEEKLPLRELPSPEHNFQSRSACGDHFHQRKRDGHGSRIQSSTWGLVFVTANWDGTLRTFHNYGLPVRI